MDAKGLLEASLQWIEKKRAQDEKANTNEFTLVSLNHCLREAAAKYADEAVIIGALTILRKASFKLKMKTHDVFRVVEATSLIEYVMRDMPHLNTDASLPSEN